MSEGGLNPVLQERKCTDVLFFLIFCAFVIGEITLAGYGYSNGDPMELIGARDRNGDLCGSGGRGDYLFFPLEVYSAQDIIDLTTDVLDLGICVDSCPSYNIVAGDIEMWTTNPDQSIEGFGVICDSGLLGDQEMIAARLGSALVDGGDDAASCFLPYPSTDIFWRCVPYDDDGFDLIYYDKADNENSDCGCYPDALNSLLDETDAVQDWLEEMEDRWETFFAAAGIALAAGFLFLMMIRMFAFLVVWGIVLLTPICCIAITVYCWVKAGKLDPNSVPGYEDELPTNYDGDISASSTNEDVFYVLAVFFTVCTVVLVLVIIGMAKRINMAIKVMKTASRAVMALPQMLFVPCISLTWDFCFLAWWIWTSLYLYTSGDYNEEDNSWDFNEDMKRALLYHVIALFWIIAFVDAIAQLTLALSVSTWYFCRKGDEFPQFPVLWSMRTTVRYHLGTCAFGSLVLAIVQTIRAIFNYLMSKLEGAKDNSIVKCVWYCVDCCLRCFERFIKFINRNAYVQTAIYATPFCVSVKNCVTLLINNAARCLAMQYAGYFILFLGKLLIAMISAVGGMYLLTSGELDSDLEGVNPLALTVYLTIGWAIGVLFMSVFEMAMDTVFQCYCLDESHATEELKQYFDEQEAESAAELQNRA